MFSWGWKRVTFSCMKKPPRPTSIPTLRNAYKVSGFRVRARIDSYDDLKHPAFALTLDRRSKKQCAADVANFVVVGMDNAGGGCVTSVAVIAKSISTFRCAA